MKVKKILNNNVILVEDSNQLEMILLGRGLALGFKPGDEIDKNRAEKIFVLESHDIANTFIELFKKVPINHLELTAKIIDAAQSLLNTSLNDSLYIALTDHINYALTRQKKGLEIKNILLWDIKEYYKKEFAAGLKALEIIRYFEGIQFPEDEAGFIAMHFVNAQENGEEMHRVTAVEQLVKNITNIVRIHYKMDLDEKSLNFNRFIAHMRNFARRIYDNEISSNEDDFIYEQLKIKCPQEYACACKIKEYVLKANCTPISKEEMGNIMLQIDRLISRYKTELH